MSYRLSISEVNRLLAAIRKHRDQRGDDRCWLDDEELYSALPEGFTPPKRDTKVELANCERFITCRQNPLTEYVSPQREIEQLRAERDSMRTVLLSLKRSPSCWCDNWFHTFVCKAAQELFAKLEKK